MHHLYTKYLVNNKGPLTLMPIIMSKSFEVKLSVVFGTSAPALFIKISILPNSFRA